MSKKLRRYAGSSTTLIRNMFKYRSPAKLETAKLRP